MWKMKFKIFIFIGLLLSFCLDTSLVYAQGAESKNKKDFLSLVSNNSRETLFVDKRSQAYIHAPSDYEWVHPASNDKVTYDFAIRDKKNPFEFQVLFYPEISGSKNDYQLESSFMQIARNAASVFVDERQIGNIVPLFPPWSNTGIYDEKALKKEKQEMGLDADLIALIGMGELKNKEHFPSYSRVHIYALQKKNTGLYVVAVLSDEKVGSLEQTASLSVMKFLHFQK